MSAVPPSVTIASSAQSARSAYDLAFQISPIMLQGGIAANAQGGILPIVFLTDGTNPNLGSSTASASSFFARYVPMPGSTLIANQVGTYPFANQTVAANAVIQQPLTLSMLMIAPVNTQGGYLKKLPIFAALQNSLALHNASGGTYSVATPAFIYNNLIMTGMTDVTHADGNQQQIEWQIDFIQPLLTAQAAQAAQNNLMATITGGGKIVGNPSWSGNVQAQSGSLSGIIAALAQFNGGVYGGSTTSTASGG